MSLEYIRDYYKVPAYEGRRVKCRAREGVITGAEGQYIRVKLDGDLRDLPYHPTWEIEYLQTPEDHP